MPHAKPSPADAAAHVAAAILRTTGRRTSAEIRHDAGFYPAKLAEVTAWADAHGFEPRNVAGAAAAFSPGFNPADDADALAWLASIGPDAEPAGENRPTTIAIPYGYASFRLAHAILWGKRDPADAMPRNVKRGEYFRAIMGDPTAWVIDVHCWRDMLGLGDRDPAPLGKLTPAQYRRYREAMIAAGFTSAEQAIIWGDRRREGQAHKNHAAA